MHFSEKAGKQETLITFCNEPKLTGAEADQSFDKRRVDLLPHIEAFLKHHERFKGKEVRVTFPTRGISSLISIIETSKEKSVLKIPLSKDYALGEAQFLQAWEKAGVQVPHVIEVGDIDGHEYTLMEFVDAPLLKDTYNESEMIEYGKYTTMGETLRKMHAPKGEGYGRARGGKGEYASFPEWIDSADMKERIAYVDAHRLLGSEHGTFEEIRNILVDHTGKDPEVSFCHDDYHAHNMFSTSPITVFDPNPRFNNGYIDFGRSLLVHIANGATEQVIEQMKRGYFGDNSYDEKVLHAAIALAGYMKFTYWHKLGDKRLEQIHAVQAYLVKNKKILQAP